ncbi:hypothetical protein [Endozoicomonas lisbonensis]|uniref:Right handed beta helix domain-containing protein n=1 Tax=Endozoicomonas lisbonensis TaxID=3120522 RepID=A0ABV2SJH3_9GAMM
MRTKFFAASFATCILAGMIGDIHASPNPPEGDGKNATDKSTDVLDYLDKNVRDIIKKELRVEDRQAIVQAISSMPGKRPKLFWIFSEKPDGPEGARATLNDIINEHKSNTNGMILLLEGDKYNINGTISLNNSFSMVGLNTYKDSDEPVKLRVHQANPDSNAYPLFTFDNRTAVFYMDFIDVETIYGRSRSTNKEHSGLIRINAAKGVYFKNSILRSPNAHHELLDIDCGFGNGSTDIGIYSTEFDMDGFDMAAISVGCKKNVHTFHNILMNNTFTINYKGLQPTPTSLNSTVTYPTTASITTPLSTSHPHDEVHELDVVYVASGNAQLTFKDSICNNIDDIENGYLYEDNAVRSHGIILLDNAKIIGKDFFTLQFNHHQALAYSRCPSFVYSTAVGCPKDSWHTDVPKPYDQFLPDKATHTNEWFSICKATPSTQPQSDASSSGGGHSNGAVAGSFFGGWTTGLMMGVGGMYVYMQRKINRITGMSGPKRFNNAESLSQQSLTAE